MYDGKEINFEYTRCLYLLYSLFDGLAYKPPSKFNPAFLHSSIKAARRILVLLMQLSWFQSVDTKKTYLPSVGL